MNTHFLIRTVLFCGPSLKLIWHRVHPEASEVVSVVFFRLIYQVVLAPSFGCHSYSFQHIVHFIRSGDKTLGFGFVGVFWNPLYSNAFSDIVIQVRRLFGVCFVCSTCISWLDGNSPRLALIYFFA